MNQILGSFRLLCILLAILDYSKALTSNLKPGESCASVCSGKEKMFKYEENKIYVYNIISRHSIKNPSSDKETIQLELKGKAEISKISACDFALQLSEITLKETLTGKDNSMKDYEMMKKLLEKYTLRFGFDDGRITGVCSDNMDNEFAVNVKKAILSGLQVSLDNLDAPNYLTETDISGDCITEYSTAPEPPNFVIIKKTKPISGCARKMKYFSTLTGQIYEQPMENRNFALLEGSYSCEIKVKRSEGLKESICIETQTFKPFSSQKTGSSLEVNQEIRFDSVRNGKIQSSLPNTRSDLVMNHGDKSPLFMKVKETPVMEIAAQICTGINQNIVSLERTKLFVQFIRSLSKADYKTIQALSIYFNTDPLCSPNSSKLKNILLDALPYAKTDDAFKFLIEDSKIYKFKNLGFSFVDNASPTIIGLFAKKLDDSNIDNSISITLSTMINSFCEKTPGCLLNPDIMDALERIVKSLGTNCHNTNQASRDKILFNLRAIGNVGNYQNYAELVKVLESCVNSPSNDNDVRVFAIEAVRKFPCNSNIDKFLWTIYDGISYNSEIRIQSYLSLIRCPTREVFRKVIQKLSNEKSQQLGSFVWSHISNIIESSDRFKTDLRDMLQIFSKPLTDLSRQFNLDFRSYSKNIEKTFQSGFTSAKLDSNIIFSSSPIPSSLSSNITLDVFGRSINIFEFGIRAKGIDKIIFQNSFATPHKNVHDDVVKMDKKIEKEFQKPNILMYSKMMGKEIFFTTDLLNTLANTAMSIGTKQSFEKSMLLLDATVSISSITGFPIEINVVSATSAEFMMTRSKKMQLMNFEMSAKNNMAVQIVGKMQINGHCTNIGVKSYGTVSTDSEFGGKFKIHDSNYITDYEFEITKMPDDRKLLSMTYESSLVHNLKTEETKPQYKSILNKCTGQTMLDLRGTQICASIESSQNFRSYLPNFKMELNIKKFNGFRFQLKKEYIKSPIRKLVSFLISTSFQDNNKDTFKFQYNRNDKEKRHLYEITLWNKDIYAKLEMKDKTVSGELQYGTVKASVTGTIQEKGMSSIVDMNLKSSSDEIILNFSRNFTKEGPIVILSATRKGDREFNFLSKTTMKYSKHLIFNYFERFRHSTNLKFYGDNEFSLIFESSRGNKPAMEMKTKFETFWKTKEKKNFLVKQDFLWTKYSIVDTSVLSEKVAGINYNITLEQQIEVKEKKFNLAHNFQYFKSKDFSPFKMNSSLVKLKLETFDLIQKKFVRQINSMLFFDLMSEGKGKFIFKNDINYPMLNFKHNLIAMTMWNRNSLNMYDIESEITDYSYFKVLFKRKYTTTQMGTFSIEVEINKKNFKILSELNLPKSHILTISWPEKTLIIDSKVDAKSLQPFNAEINHDIKLDGKLLVTITNIAEYNNENTKLSFTSIGKNTSALLYSVNIEGQFKANLLYYDIETKVSIKIPSHNLDFVINNKQFANLNIDAKAIGSQKSFESKFTYLDKNSKKMYGYAMTSERLNNLIKIDNNIYRGSLTDKIVFSYSKEPGKCNIGVNIALENYANYDWEYRMTYEKEKITTAHRAVLEVKNNDKYNFNYKNNIVIMVQNNQNFVLTWDGKYGKSANSILTPFKGSIKFQNSGFKKFDVIFDLAHPLLSRFQLANVLFGFTFEVSKLEKEKAILNSNLIIKWQKEEERTSKYYELKINGDYNLDNKNMIALNFDTVLTKDSSLTKLIEAQVKIQKNDTSLDTIFKFIYDTKRASLNMNYDYTTMKKYAFNFSIMTSTEILKEFSLSSELQMIGFIYHMKSNMNLSSTTPYSIEINQVRKIDINNGLDYVSSVKWMSNVPYLQSGSYGVGILLSKSKNFKFNFSLFYLNAKKINVKLSADGKISEIQILFESFIKDPLKLALYINMPSITSIILTAELGYMEKFIKIQDMKLNWSVNNKLTTSEFTMTVLSSNENLDIFISTDSSYEIGNELKTYVYNEVIKNKGKEIHVVNFNIPKGEIKIESTIGQYMTNFYMKDVKFDLKFKYNSKRDMMIKCILQAEPLFSRSELELIYFRKEKDEKPKVIESMGEATFYNKLQISYKDNNINQILFINKDFNKATYIMKVNLPVYKWKLVENLMEIEFNKETENVYKGTAKYSDMQYNFKYEDGGILKKNMELIAVNKDISPQKILMSYDFTKNGGLKISVDKNFIVDINMEKKTSTIIKGIMKINYKMKDIIDLNSETEVTIPENMKIISDYWKFLIGIEKGLHIKNKVKGTLFEINLDRSMELYHLESKQFPGGFKSYMNVDMDINSAKPFYQIMFSYDRLLPKFEMNNLFLVKYNEKVKLDMTTNVKWIAMNDFQYDSKFYLENKTKSMFVLGNNIKNMQMNYNMDIIEKESKYGFGFMYFKGNNDLYLHVAYLKNIYSLKTNVGNLIEIDRTRDEYLSFGKEYYITYQDKYEIRIMSKSKLNYDLLLNYNWKEPLKLSIGLINENTKSGLSVKGSSPFEKAKQFNVKLEIESDKGFKKVKYIFNLRVNKKLLSDLIMTFTSVKNSPTYEVKIDITGQMYIIKGQMEINIVNYRFNHAIEVKDADYKTDLWSSTSKCYLQQDIDCYTTYRNNAREMIVGINWNKNLKRFEFTWNKNKGQSVIFSIENKGNMKLYTMQNPIRKITMKCTKIDGGDLIYNTGIMELNVKAVDKSTNKDVSFMVKYKMKGSLRSDYKLDVNITTSLMHKEIKLTVKRDVSLDIGDLYTIDINAFFDEEKLPFLGMKGYLRRLSSRSYEIKLHSTNYAKYAILTSTAIFASEELTLEYKLEQSDQPTKEFLIQYIPISKLHITNKKDFKILMSRIIYQHGYRCDYALKLGPSGVNIVGFSSLTKNPMKYYAEFDTQDQKIVIHFRPVGDSFIGELYRKTSDKKILDIHLKVKMDENNILNSKLIWKPEMFDNMKAMCGSIFIPENIQNLMTRTYQNAENQMSSFTNNVKLDVVRNLNVPDSLEFMKGLANDWDKFPKFVVQSYENDDLFMKSMMSNITNYINKLDLSVRFFKLQLSMNEVKDALSKTMYEWFIDAKLYTVLYQPLKTLMNSFTYEDLKARIINVVEIGKFSFRIYKNSVNIVANILDKIGEKARSVVNISLYGQETITLLFKNSMLGEALIMLSDIKNEIINVVGQIMKTDIVKQRIKYYQDSLNNAREIIDLVMDFRNKTLEYFSTSSLISNFVKTVRLIKSMQYKEAFLNFIKIDETKFNMDLDEASMELRFYVPPISRTYLKMTRTFTSWLPSMAFFQKRKSSLGDRLLDLFYRYEYIVFNYGTMDFMAFRKIIPPFAKSAWVLNGKSIITFDDSAITLGKGKCSYLLARDFRSKSFSIVMNVDSDKGLKEFELIYFKKITITQSGLVKVDGTFINALPKIYINKFKNIVIYRDNDMIKIKTSEGITMKYFYKLDSFKVMVTGSWHGYIKGLLGSNDFENINDWSTPNGLITHDAGILAKSWSLGACNTKTKTGLYSIKVNQIYLQKCIYLFKPDSISYLKRCHSSINPDPYFELCYRSLQYDNKKDFNFYEMVCNLSRNYITRCKAKGIMLRLYKTCVKCDNNKNLNDKVSQTDLSKDRKFNYIFIMEQSKCLQTYKGLVDNLANILGYDKKNIFSLVAYNGQNILKDAHFKSINNDITTNKDGFVKLLKEFWSSDQISDFPDKKTSQPSKAIYDVIKMSSQAGYTERIILISCSACNDHQKYIYSLLAGLLNKAGISITYLTNQSFTGTDADSNTVGLGNKLVFYSDTKTGNIMSRPWKRNVQAPKDACSPLARLKQGFVWSMKPLDSEMKMRRLAEKVQLQLQLQSNNKKEIQQCYCNAGNYDTGSIECKVSKSKRSNLLF